jgi:hypothetical protein
MGNSDRNEGAARMRTTAFEQQINDLLAKLITAPKPVRQQELQDCLREVSSREGRAPLSGGLSGSFHLEKPDSE